jgi:hypothetical protein
MKERYFMTRIISGIFVSALLLSCVGCGGSHEAPPPAPIVFSQGNLPDAGYWLCRLDSPLNLRNRASATELTAAGESLTLVKQKIERSCRVRAENRRRAENEECLAAAQNNRFACVRAANSGGMNEYPGPTTCQLSYDDSSGNGPRRLHKIGARGSTQEYAAAAVFRQCVRSFRSVECTQAILSNAMICRPTR